MANSTISRIGGPNEQNKTDPQNVQPGPQQALDSGADWCFPQYSLEVHGYF